ncbi:hypothetical protein PGT21_035506 [Puccinia graminis f. sp. tritici]|uniref:Secreted protein n=1 Tax=Puccinia graminis f. sp. tritici TaxID=56615 RepID=A0A5B0P0L1_PUCGR|nr:hypothetical protein PGT21_035506 [Puccinia graminis f. sp. tritici]
MLLSFAGPSKFFLIYVLCALLPPSPFQSPYLLSPCHLPTCGQLPNDFVPRLCNTQIATFFQSGISDDCNRLGHTVILLVDLRVPPDGLGMLPGGC